MRPCRHDAGSNVPPSGEIPRFLVVPCQTHGQPETDPGPIF